jgi:hypothetical protein
MRNTIYTLTAALALVGTIHLLLHISPWIAYTAGTLYLFSALALAYAGGVGAVEDEKPETPE